MFYPLTLVLCFSVVTKPFAEHAAHYFIGY